MALKDWTIITSPSSVSCPLLLGSSEHFADLLLPSAVFGSAQLRGHKHLRPKAIHDNDILEEFSKDYMYLSYIRYINSVRTSHPLCSTSPG